MLAWSITAGHTCTCICDASMEWSNILKVNDQYRKLALFETQYFILQFEVEKTLKHQSQLYTQNRFRIKAEQFHNPFSLYLAISSGAQIGKR
jgi:hypothetical protein